MPTEEILTGINNALARGQSLQAAVQTLINSGYPPQEVYEASRYAGVGIISEIKEEPKNNSLPNLQLQEPQNQMQYKALPKNPQDKSYPIEVKNNQKRSFAWAIVLIMILLVLIIILGIFIWKGESILNSLFG